MQDIAFTEQRDHQVVSLTPNLGAEVNGVNIREDMPAEDIRFIHRMLLRHRVVFFRNQHHVTDGVHKAFVRHFGDIVGHPTVAAQADPSILELHSHQGGRANSWHTDVTFELRPPKLSILRAITLPAIGGDTVWANTVEAYKALPENLRCLADRLWAVHGNDFDYAASRVELLHDDVARRYRRQYAAQVIKSEHPVVSVHPETGERNLLLGHYAQRFVHCNTHDSTRLYEIFQAHITRLENTIRWRWAPGDVALWDNRSTQHYAINDYGSNTRIMRRVTVTGDVPMALDGSRSRVHEF